MARQTTIGRRSAKQRAQLQAINLSKQGQENIKPAQAASQDTKPKLLINWKNKTTTCQRKIRHLRAQNSQLRGSVYTLKGEAVAREKELWTVKNVQKSQEETQGKLDLAIQSSERRLFSAANELKEMRSVVRKLQKKIARREAIRNQMLKNSKRTSVFKTMNRQAYSKEVRKLTRLMVAGGCARGKVGALLCEIGNGLGVHIKKAMSERTVSRTMLEGLVASKSQMAYEISQSKGMLNILLIFHGS